MCYYIFLRLSVTILDLVGNQITFNKDSINECGNLSDMLVQQNMARPDTCVHQVCIKFYTTCIHKPRVVHKMMQTA